MATATQQHYNSANGRIYPQDWMVEFISTYREMPCLWKVKSVDYRNKRKKKEAYQKLLKLFQRVEPAATVDTLKRKIDCFRGSFRRQLRILRDHEAQGLEYEPKLWYFDLLLFTADQENEDFEFNMTRTHFMSTSVQEQSDEASEIDNNYDWESTETNQSYTPHTQSTSPPPSKKCCPSEVEDEITLFCQSLSAQIRKLPEMDAIQLMNELQNKVTESRLKVINEKRNT